MKIYFYPLPKIASLILFQFLLTTSVLRAQDGGRNKAIYVEGLGSGLILSLNYDFRFKPTQDGLGMRVGIGGARISDRNSDARAGAITMPILVNYLIGKRRAAFEVGAGVTPIYISASGTDDVSGELISGKGVGVFGSLNAGLRLQPVRNGVIFRLNWTPIITSEGFQARWLGLSLGYAFK
ncbi:hypothetical protein GCM10027299_38540 [Larkinella ripae]